MERPGSPNILWTGEPINSVIRTDAGCTRCIVCGSSTVAQFCKEYLGTRVHYYRCLACDHLTAGEVSESPNYERATYFSEIDTGWQDRNRRVLEFIVLLSRIPGINLHHENVILDYGCGTGALVSSLNGAGFHAFGYEPFTESIQTGERILCDWSQVPKTVGHANLITCIEVLEHLRRPDETLKRFSELLSSDGYLFVSTESYLKDSHQGDWYYLNPAAGHVSIYSARSILSLMSRHGFFPVIRVNGSTWLFRSGRQRSKTWLESAYYSLSCLRLKLGIKIR